MPFVDFLKAGICKLICVEDSFFTLPFHLKETFATPKTPITSPVTAFCLIDVLQQIPSLLGYLQANKPPFQYYLVFSLMFRSIWTLISMSFA